MTEEEKKGLEKFIEMMNKIAEQEKKKNEGLRNALEKLKQKTEEKKNDN